MNALVARYSQPAALRESYSDEDQHELCQTKPSLSLKFTLPPIANVSVVKYLIASSQAFLQEAR